MRSLPRPTALRTLLIAGALALPTLLSASPAQADSCTTNLQGIVASHGATAGKPDACAPQVGRPEGTGTGRKVG
jgi:hypothetical protein